MSVLVSAFRHDCADFQVSLASLFVDSLRLYRDSCRNLRAQDID